MPRIYNAPTIHKKLKIDEPQELKALLIVGPYTKIDPKIKALYEKNNNCLIIGDGVNQVTSDNIKDTLKKKNLGITKNTRVDINAHGLQEEKKHFIQLGVTESTYKTSTKEFFKELRSISDSPLYVHLWSCYGGSANKDTNSLGNGSILVTHIESKEAASTALINDSMENSLNRYFKENLSPYQQFIRDLKENYETNAFNKVTNTGVHRKFKTMRTPKNDTMAKIIGGIKNEENLANFINHFFLEEGNRFLDIFDKEMSVNDKAQVKKVTEQISSLSEEEAKKYALGVLIHVSSIDQIESKNLVDLIRILVWVQFTGQIVKRLIVNSQTLLVRNNH